MRVIYNLATKDLISWGEFPEVAIGADGQPVEGMIENADPEWVNQLLSVDAAQQRALITERVG